MRDCKEVGDGAQRMVREGIVLTYLDACLDGIKDK